MADLVEYWLCYSRSEFENREETIVGPEKGVKLYGHH